MADDFPLAGMGDPVMQRMMTHYASQPNPAQPYVQALQAFLGGGLQGVANQQGIETPAWSKSLGAILSSPEANAALGVLRTPVDLAKTGRATRTLPLNLSNEPGVLGRVEQRLSEGPRIVPRDQQDAILRQNWENHGADLDYDFNNWRSWDKEVKLWNQQHSGNQMPDDNYQFGSNKEFESMFDAKYLAGHKAPYPGAKAANEYFQDDRPDLTAYTSRRQIPDDMLPPERQ